MSAQFGRWNLDRRPIEAEYLKKVRELLAPYGPDGETAYIKEGTAILCRALHTTLASRAERQPFVLNSGEVLTWDGRLDSRSDLERLLESRHPEDRSDGALAAIAYERWGTNCFARLIGDWALAIWNPIENLLILAKDPIGSRHLYYTTDDGQIIWSSILDPLVLLAEKTFDLDEEYMAGWLGMFPAAHLTPYVGVFAVPPSHYVRLWAGQRSVVEYWNFDPAKSIRYASDSEYEEHFRAVFRESVRRRLRSDSPVLAELSGGMDSSSIVCMADAILAQGGEETPRLDTVSYFDDSEPNWNERPYVAVVESKRGCAGSHINAGTCPTFDLALAGTVFAATPGSGPSGGGKANLLADCLVRQGSRVLLSGIGGDEVTGGVPSPTPELADLLARARFLALASRLKDWALAKRRPWIRLLIELAQGFFPIPDLGLSKHLRGARWIADEFVRRNRRAMLGYPARFRIFGPLPSFQENIAALDAVRRQLGCIPPPCSPPYEKRYPFLDREFLEFMFALPRTQLVRPRQRRSLLRRALAGTVPESVLNRRRKAFVIRRPLDTLARNSAALSTLARDMLGSSLGILDREGFSEALDKARAGREFPIAAFLRALQFECWLRGLDLEHDSKDFKSPFLPSCSVFECPRGNRPQIKVWLAASSTRERHNERR